MFLENWLILLYTRTDQFFWSEDGLKVGSEKWDYGNTANGDRCRGLDRETSNISMSKSKKFETHINANDGWVILLGRS